MWLESSFLSFSSFPEYIFVSRLSHACLMFAKFVQELSYFLYVCRGRHVLCCSYLFRFHLHSFQSQKISKIWNVCYFHLEIFPCSAWFCFSLHLSKKMYHLLIWSFVADSRSSPSQTISISSAIVFTPENLSKAFFNFCRNISRAGLNAIGSLSHFQCTNKEEYAVNKLDARVHFSHHVTKIF